ncbi:hypothetical protein [Methylocucumis oryzae]|uniref:hypothetical protein n=1 Tax=Methylocucumis oryzae TaxID=1632867 RepID=UPI0006985A73|nr:hypothetical protein [Methylocucumis oryzae]
MNGSDGKNNDESNGLKTKWLVITLCSIALTILGFYFSNFHGSLSSDNSAWGTFGDYVGGILNPVIAAFAFYLIARTYELQKKELKATRELLEISTKAQKDQIKLAALTALLDSNLARISLLNAERVTLWDRLPAKFKSFVENRVKPPDFFDVGVEESRTEEYYPVIKRIHEIDNEINMIVEKNSMLTKGIEDHIS